MIENPSIPLDCRIVQSQGNIVSDMDGEKVMLNIHNGNYYNLGKTGGRIWELIESPISIVKLVQVIVSEYDIEHAICENHVISFIQHLREEKLVEFGEKLQYVVPGGRLVGKDIGYCE